MEYVCVVSLKGYDTSVRRRIFVRGYSEPSLSKYELGISS